LAEGSGRHAEPLKLSRTTDRSEPIPIREKLESIMPDTPVVGEPSARTTAVEWPDVIRMMRTEAGRTNDEWHNYQADVLEVGVLEHWYGWSEGCSTCGGHFAVCPEWDHAQSIALTWLARKAGLA
jgi:hypothetical protein